MATAGSGLECCSVASLPFPGGEASPRTRALAVGLLAAALLGSYLWVPNDRGSNDNYAHCLTALSLARGEWGRLDHLREYWASTVLDLRATVIETPDGHVVGGTGIGAALALAPFYAVALLAGAGPVLVLSPPFNHPIAALWSVMAVVAFFLTIRRLVEPGPALLATTTLALGSSVLSVLSREPWQHTILVTLQCVALWLVLKPGATSGRRWALAAGVLLGWGGLVRATAFLYVLPWAWLVRRAGRDRLRPFLVGVLPGVLATLAYNWWTFGRPWLLGQIIIGRVRFGYEASQAVPYDPLGALAGLLVSPGRGLFLYSPVFLWALLVLGAAVIVRRCDKAGGRGGLAPWPFWLAPAVAIIAVNLASAATWKEWAGGWTYGPRYLADTIPLWGLVVAAAAQAGRSRATVPRGLTALAWPLLALSIAFHAAGLLVSPYRSDAYSARTDPDHHPERLWRWRDFPPLDNLRLWLRDRAPSGRTRAP